MKNQIFLYALVLVTVFGGISTAFAQESDEYTECTQLLNSPPLNDVLTRNDRHDFWQLDARKQGAVLMGLKCSHEELNHYFLSSGWEFIESRLGKPTGPLGGEFQYYTDSAYIYCHKSRNLINLYLLRCTSSAVLSFFEGEISFVNVGASK
jgi:hypothetical protein